MIPTRNDFFELGLLRSKQSSQIETIDLKLSIKFSVRYIN